MLKLYQWTAAISAIMFVLALLGAAYLSSPPTSNPSEQQSTAEQEASPQNHEKGEARPSLLNWLFPDALSFFTFWLVVSTVGLGVVAVVQLGFLGRQETIASESALAAKEASQTAREALVKSNRAFIGVEQFPWVWRPDAKRPGKFVYNIAPFVENSGVTPTVNMTIVRNYALRDTPLPEGFDFPYDGAPGNTIVGPRGNIKASYAVITDDDLLAVRDGKKFFYIWGVIKYRDVFDGTPIHITEFATQIVGVPGNPLDPRHPSDPTGTTVEIFFSVYKEHNNRS